jgi:hypothetical protein
VLNASSRILFFSTLPPLQSCRLAGGGRGFDPLHISTPGIGGHRLSDPEVPTKLAYLSIIGAGLAIAHPGAARGVIGLGIVDASLVGSGIGDADAGIFGACLRW